MRKRIVPFALLFMIIGMGIGAQTVTYSHAPGLYNSDIAVQLSVAPRYRLTLQFPDSITPNEISYTRPIELSALPGETRKYRVVVSVYDQEKGNRISSNESVWIIDKRPPTPSILQTPPGEYERDISLSFQILEENATVWYSINDTIEHAVQWKNIPINLPYRKGVRSEYHVICYTRDTAGNCSPPEYHLFVTGRQQERAQALTILSPIPGVYYNTQLLVISGENYEWIRYIIGTGDPAKEGTYYSGPVLIRNTGEVSISVAAMPIGGDRPLVREITYTVSGREPSLPAVNPSMPQGIYTEGILFTIPAKGLYTFSERMPEEGDRTSEDPVKLSGIPNGIRVIPINFRDRSSSRSADARYRWTYVIDQRIPEKPVIVLDSDEPITADTFVTIKGSPFGTTYYTTDGTTPDKSKERYTYPFQISVPEDGTGSILIRAVSVSPAGVKGEEVNALIAYDKEIPESPRILSIKRGYRYGSIEIMAEPDIGCELIYEISINSSIPKNPDSNSAVLPRIFTLAMPYGMDGIITMKMASRDRAGNISEATEPLAVPIDLNPPKTPVITVENDQIIISGENPIYYTISLNGAPLPVPSTKSRVYAQPIPVPVKPGEFSSITVQARSIDSNGNQSALSETFTVTKDLRNPVLPILGTVRAERLYNAPVSLPIPQSSYKVRYEISADGTDPKDPDLSSPVVSGGVLSFDGVEGEEIAYSVKIAPFTGDTRGTIESFRIFVDRKFPNMPVPSGFPDSGLSDAPMRISVPGEESVRLYAYCTKEPVELRENELFSELNLWNGEDYLTAIPGETVSAYYYFGAEDLAGNRTINPKRYGIVIDRTYPPIPVFNGYPKGMSTSNRVGIEIKGEGTVRYEVTNDGSFPPVPATRSETAKGTLQFNGEAGKEIIYTISAIAFDSAGNSSRDAGVLRFIIDRNPPAPPSAPRIVRSFPGLPVIVSWDKTDESSYYYQLGDGPALLYVAPFSVLHSDRLTYYSMDDAGNRSEVNSIDLDVKELPSSLVTGFSGQTLYNDSVLIKPTPGYIIRYEIGTTSMPPQEPGPSSPVMQNTISINSNPGETQTFILIVKGFASPDDLSGFRTESYGFTIDRTPPNPPNIIGITDSAHYQEDILFSFAQTQDKIYYSVESEPSTTTTAGGTPYAVYSEPVRLSTPAGTIRSFTISAYTTDVAGNRSSITLVRSITIDKELLYVSLKGDDNFEGTRVRPLRTLEAALEYAAATDRRTICVSSGIHNIAKRIVISSEITFIGGFDENTWEYSGKSPSVIMASKRYPTNDPLIAVDSGSLTLRNISVSDSFSSAEALISVGNGNVILENVSLTRENGDNRTLVRVEKGSISISDSYLILQRMTNATGIVLSGGSAELSDTIIQGDNIEQSCLLVDISNGGRFSAEETSFYPGKGKDTVALRSVNSSVNMVHCTISSGAAETAGVAVRSESSDIRILDSEITGEKSGRIVTLLELSDSKAAIMRCTLVPHAGVGATAIRAVRSEIDMTLSKIASSAPSEFLMFCSLKESSGRFLTNIIIGSYTDDMRGFVMEKSSTTWLNNTISIKNGRVFSTGACFSNSPDTVFINNIFIATGSGTPTTCLRIDGGLSTFVCKNNCLSGFAPIITFNGGIKGRTIAELNLSDGDAEGGNIDGNITEPADRIFASSDSFELNQNSMCVDGGLDPRKLGGLDRDWSGRKRPDPDYGSRLKFDIGAFEY